VKCVFQKNNLQVFANKILVEEAQTSPRTSTRNNAKYYRKKFQCIENFEIKEHSRKFLNQQIAHLPIKNTILKFTKKAINWSNRNLQHFFRQNIEKIIEVFIRKTLIENYVTFVL
jgi:hypothetical protein